MKLDLDSVQNIDENSANILFSQKMKRVKKNGSGAQTAKQDILQMVRESISFRGGDLSRFHSECMSLKKDRSNLQPFRLALKTDALIMQNPPRKIRAYS